MNNDGINLGPEWLSFGNRDNTKISLSSSSDHHEEPRSYQGSPRLARLSPGGKTPLKYTRSKSTPHLFGEQPEEPPKSDVFTMIKERNSFDKNFPTLNKPTKLAPPPPVSIPNNNNTVLCVTSPKENTAWRTQVSSPTSPLISNHLVFAPSSTSLTSSLSNSSSNSNPTTPTTPTMTIASSSSLSASSSLSPNVKRLSLQNSSENSSNIPTEMERVRSPTSSFSVMNPNFSNSNPIESSVSDSMSMDQMMRGLVPTNQSNSSNSQKPSLLNRTRAELLVPPSKKIGAGGKIIPPFVKFNPPTFRKSSSEPTLPLSPAYEEKYAKLMASQKKPPTTSKLKETYFENYDNIQTKPRTPSSSSTGSSGSSDRNDFFLNLLNQEEQKKKKLEGDQSDAEQSSFVSDSLEPNDKTKNITSEEDEEKFLRNLGWVPEEEDHVPELTEDEIKDIINGADKLRIHSPSCVDDRVKKINIECN